MSARRSVAALAVAALVVLLGGAPPIDAASPTAPPDRDPRTYRPPVAAPVVDPFRPPPEPWLAGNRGLEYGTAPGTPVGAIGPGTVSFAGPVAGSLHVTVTHPDGLRSSYSFLAAVRVRAGDVVAPGDVVGIAAERLHLGVRRGDRYLDPATLWGRRVEGGRVRLVPLGDGAPAGERDPPPPGLGPPPAPARGLAAAGAALAGTGPSLRRALGRVPAG
ncbi:MAG TPA: M23 family metallopeptidase [Aquihabitans sp.]|jgi:murein DD-endopeptidase MepM/ murein hydrolase activator NlpD|nr:M23 family metallopeptidase [Aquihabitans sp.]